MRDPRLVTDIDSEPSPVSDDGRLLALLESRLDRRVPVFEVERAAHLQYAARAHTLRHVYGYVIVNGEGGRTSEGRKRTWFSLIGRLTRSQFAALKDLCKGKRTRYDAAIVQVFPQAAAYLTRCATKKPALVRNYPTMPHAESTPVSATPSFPTFGNLAKESYGVD